MPSSKQRIEVWNGKRKKTSGGLTKDMLVKNKRGKIVSKRKSDQASDQNNLGDFLRPKGKPVPKDEMLYKKGQKKKESPKKKKKEDVKSEKPKKVAAPPKPKAKAAPKAAATKVAPKKMQPKAPPKPKKKQAAPKKKANPKINPATKQPYAAKSKSGYVKDAKVHIDNVRPRRAKRRDRLSRAERRKLKVYTQAEIDASY